MRTLRRENAKEITMERLAIRAVVAGSSEGGAYGVCVLFGGAVWREEAIMLPLVAGEMLGVLLDVRASFRRIRIILILSADYGAQGVYGPHFVLADAAVHDFAPPKKAIEIKSAIALDDGDRQGPVFGADIESSFVVRFFHEPMHLLVFLGELIVLGIAIVRAVGPNNYVTGVGAEDGDHGVLVMIADGIIESFGCFLGRGKGLVLGARAGLGFGLRRRNLSGGRGLWRRVLGLNSNRYDENRGEQQGPYAAQR